MEGHNAYMLIPLLLKQAGSKKNTSADSPSLGELVPSAADLPILVAPIQNIYMNHEGLNRPLVMVGYLQMVACPISGNTTAQQDFLSELSIY